MSVALGLALAASGIATCTTGARGIHMGHHYSVDWITHVSLNWITGLMETGSEEQMYSPLGQKH